jgi:hypothetical protein
MASKAYSSNAPKLSREQREAQARMVQTGLLQQQPVSAVDDTLAQRGARYGDFTDHARVCQDLKRTIYAGPTAHKLSDVQRQALDVIADKIARIVCGDPNYDDNWHDIQGYAKLVEDRLPE